MLRNLWFQVLVDDTYWEEDVTAEYRRTGQGQPLSWEMSDDDGVDDGDEKQIFQKPSFEIAQQLFPKLTIVKKQSFTGNNASRELVYRILEALPEQQIRKLESLERSFLISGLTSDEVGSIFRRQSTTLREIVLAGCWNIDSGAIRTILVECVALGRLEVQSSPLDGSNYRYHHLSLCISLDDTIKSPWGCTRIQDLNLTIAIPDEPLHRSKEMGVVPNYNRPPPTTLSRAETAQFQSLEALYQQLGALTGLERVELKAIYYDPVGGRSADTMLRTSSFVGMLNLKDEETGRPGYLHLLGGLIKLKVLSGSVFATAQETKVTIGMDEVKWMDKHWPMLEKAHFLAKKG
ncbi:MAG: hypothetical protein JOS17DRAFT_795339 [Linnemannia elongata]|nr:MAG: hypothetical protein JOS17DRAFT_795339 [Linnemannia elongata]